MDTTPQTDAEPRFRHRVPCSIRLAGREHRALILNLSEGGLFVRTTARAQPGDPVEIDLAIDEDTNSIELKADVVWRRISNTNVSHMTEGGIGLRLGRSPEAYSHFVRTLGGEAETTEATAPLEPFEILLKLRGAPRSRSLRLDAASGDDAAEQALAKAGQDWEVLEVRAKSGRS